MKNNKSLEDYLECILLLSRENEFVHRVDVARKVGVSQPAVQKAVKILQSENYIECDGLHIYLTPQGRSYAEEVYERHCTLRRFLVLHGVNAADADADACEIEHVISDATFAAVKKYVENNK
ncbi:MAG: metal-dependent transcriptional regulator [Clostridia bacterium]|nr:metal-dependent transcriptional regulator [Clostridia bacterium]